MDILDRAPVQTPLPCGCWIPAPCGACRQVNRAKTRARAYGYRGEHFSGPEWLDLLEAFGRSCLACGTVPGPETPPEEGLTVDHIIPLSLGAPIP